MTEEEFAGLIRKLNPAELDALIDLMLERGMFNRVKCDVQSRDGDPPKPRRRPEN
jgi:hypothetical protein